MSPPNFSGSNISLVKSHNLQAILMSLLYEPHLSRVELAQRTSLSSTTITNLIGELIEQDIVFEAQAPSDTQRSVGRPRRRLEINPNARYAVGVHIGIGLYRVAVTNLQADIIANNIETFEIDISASEILTRVSKSIHQTITESAVPPEKLLGIGVGASGLVDYRSGLNVIAPRLGWHNVQIRDILEEQSQLPVIVDNNVRSMALLEALFGIGKGASVLAFVYGRIGVGAGFFVNGRLFRGSGVGAGEIGHSISIPKDGEICTCGNRGCLETLLSETILIKQAQEQAIQIPDSILAKEFKANNDQKPIASIFSAARMGDQFALELIAERADHLGIALANLVNVINPEMILLGGMFAEGGDLFIPKAREKMQQTAFAGLADQVRLEKTKYGWRAGVAGAAALALAAFFYQQSEGI